MVAAIFQHVAEMLAAIFADIAVFMVRRCNPAATMGTENITG